MHILGVKEPLIDKNSEFFLEIKLLYLLHINEERSVSLNDGLLTLCFELILQNFMVGNETGS